IVYQRAQAKAAHQSRCSQYYRCTRIQCHPSPSYLNYDSKRVTKFNPGDGLAISGSNLPVSSRYNLVFNLEIDGLRPTRIVPLNHYKQTAYFSRIRGELQAKNGADQ